MKIENHTHIHAPSSVVWEVTIDLQRWPEWTPTVVRVRRLDQGELSVGSQAELQQPGLPTATWTVTELVPCERFTWETQVRGLHMRATHELTPAGEGTDNLLRLEVRGLAAWLLWPAIRYSATKTLAQENAGLKNFCESPQEAPG